MINSRNINCEGIKEEHIDYKNQIGEVICKMLDDLLESEKQYVKEGYIIDNYNLNVTFFENDFIALEHKYVDLTYIELINKLYIDSYRAHNCNYDVYFEMITKGHKYSKPITNHIKN